ncbi:MAG: cyclic nucleotide-binding domain-containing protein [Nevskia sp.]|jgi:CRP/FNR family transcriptional regulator|nr:cyclic nucleotide-binding domain-containing protein [Nevskia sp.]MCK9385625.1 cyclic nucleotide-binding domain-containing protein [Nevskia sp.]
MTFTAAIESAAVIDAAAGRCAGCSTRESCLGGLKAAGVCGFSDSSGRSVERGQHLFRAGEAIHCVFVLRSGAIKTYVTAASGDEQILGFYSPGDVIGYDSISAGKHSRNAVALVPAEVCRIPLESLVQSCAQSADLLNRLLAGMGQEIQRLQGMLKMERLTAEQRIALFLLNQARRQGRTEGSAGGYVLQLAMTRGEIGRFLDLATETVSRTLTRLKEAGLIQIDRSGIRLLNPTALHRIVQSQPVNSVERIAA